MRLAPLLTALLLLAGCADPGRPDAEPSGPTATPAPSLAPAFADAPHEFYAVLGGRIAAFDTVTGTRLSYLTTPPPGSTDRQPTVIERGTARSVAFLREPDDRECGGTEVLVVQAAGGDPLPVADLPEVEVSAYGIDRTGTSLAYGYTRCGDDTRPWVRVVSLPDGKTVAEARSLESGNGSLSLSSLSVDGPYVAVSLGIHLQFWVAVLDVRKGDSNLDTLPHLPAPDGCRPGGVVWTDEPGAPTLTTTLTCQRDESYDVRLATYSGSGFRRSDVGEPMLAEPGFVELSGSDGRGHLLGIHGTDDDRTYSREVVQLVGTERRTLAPCAQPDGTDDACAETPVW